MKKVLLVIDVQQQFVNSAASFLPAKIAAFLTNNESKFDHVFFFKFKNDRQSNWFQQLGWKQMLEDSEIKLAAELRPFASQENSFVKQASFSVFRVDSFVNWLRQQTDVEFYLAGLDTDACIYQTALEAFERGYPVKVVTDLCAASHGKKYHRCALKCLERNLGQQVLIDSASFD